MNVSKTGQEFSNKNHFAIFNVEKVRISLLRALNKQSFKFFILLENLVNNTQDLFK